MKIKKIKIKGFKSIADETIIDFDELQGLVKVTGNVGAGKTSIGEAILYGLFGTVKGKNNGDLVSYKTNDLLVEIDVQCAENNITVKRGMKRAPKSGTVSNTIFECTNNGEPIVFSNKKEAQSILERDYYDTNKLSIELFCIISFNNFKSLLTMKAADKTAFLDEIFGFDVISNYTDATKRLIKDSNLTIDMHTTNIEKFNSNIETLNGIIMPEKLNYDNLKEAYLDAQNRKKAFEDARTAESEELNVKMSELNDRMTSENADLSEIVTLGNKVKKDIDTFKTGVCPTCGQPVEQCRIDGLMNERKELADKYLTKKSLIAGIQSQQSEIRSDLNRIATTYNGKITECEDIMNDARQRVAVNKKVVAQAEEQIKQRDEKIEKLQSQITEEQTSLDAEMIDKNIYSDILNIITGKIKSKIIKSFVPSINNNVLKYTKALGLPFIVTFDEEFNVVVKSTIYNKEISVVSLSTGQTKAIDTCIIIGILDALLNKINFNVTFFDELLSNMHDDLRDDICKILKDNCKEGTTLFLINHSPLKDEYFNHSIEVVNRGGSQFIIS